MKIFRWESFALFSYVVQPVLCFFFFAIWITYDQVAMHIPIPLPLVLMIFSRLFRGFFLPYVGVWSYTNQIYIIYSYQLIYFALLTHTTLSWIIINLGCWWAGPRHTRPNPPLELAGQGLVRAKAFQVQARPFSQSSGAKLGQVELFFYLSIFLSFFWANT